MPNAAISIATIDSSILRRLIGAGPTPGVSREIHNAGVLRFEGSSPSGDGPLDHHRFVVEFGTENAAAALANWLWSTLHGHASTLRIGDDEVPIQNGAIKRALIAASLDHSPRKTSRG
jgi:hypothetical protein